MTAIRAGLRQVTTHLKILATVATAAFAAAVKSMADFNRQLALTGTLGEEARAHLEGFSVAVKKIAVDTGIPLEQLNKALFDTISAGTKAADAIKVLGEASRLAVAGGANLATTVRGLATITNAYGISGQKSFRMVAEELFAAQVIGKTTIDDLSENIGKLASTSAEAGLSIRHMFTALADTANVSANTEQAAVSLRQAIMAILKPNDDMIKVLRRAEIPLGVAAFQWGSLGEIFSSVKESAAEMNIPFVTVLGNVRAIASASVLAQRNGERWSEMLGRQSKLAGELAISYENMQKQLAQTIDRAKNLGRILAQSFATGATIGLNHELQELLENYERISAETELAGLKFRKFIERDIRPLIERMLAAFKFMGASATLVMSSIEAGFDSLFSAIKEGLRETSSAMEAWGLIDSPIDKFNDDLERFRTGAQKSEKALSGIKDEISKVAGGVTDLFGEGATDWDPDFLAKQLRTQVPSLQKALGEIHGEIESLTDYEIARGQPHELFARLQETEKKLLEYTKPLKEIESLLEKQTTLEEEILRHEGHRNHLIRVRASLVDQGAMAENAAAKLSDESLRKRKGFWELELSHFSDLREARADSAEAHAFEERAEKRRLVQVQAVKDVRESMLALEKLNASTSDGGGVIATIDKQIAKLEVTLQRMENIKALKNLADVTGITAAIGWVDKFRERILAAMQEAEDLKRGLLSGGDGKLDDSIDWWVNFKKGMQVIRDELKVTEDTFKDMGKRVMQSLEDSVQSIFQGFIEGKDTAKDALVGFLRAISQELTKFMAQAVVRQFLAAFFATNPFDPKTSFTQLYGIDQHSAADPIPTGFASGGIVNSPTLAMIGEGGQNEAVVPLPDGRAIPVDFRGGGQGGNININISAVDGPSVQRMLLSDEGRRAIQNAIRDGRSTRRDLR